MAQSTKDSQVPLIVIAFETLDMMAVEPLYVLSDRWLNFEILKEFSLGVRA